MSGGDDVVVAILAKDKSETLPLYLACLTLQSFPKSRIHLWVRANDCSDNTVELLQRWLDVHGSDYKSVTADFTDIGGLRHYANHEWDSHRFAVLGRIRQESVDHARRLGCHYFVSDVDNAMIPTTLQSMVESGLPVVAPLLRTPFSDYANFFPRTNPDGYAVKGLPEYYSILHGQVRGLFIVDLVHCTYFVRADIVDDVSYDDGSGRYEYAIFADVLRRKGIPQYIDNRQVYGLVGFLGGEEAESWGRFDHVDFAGRIANLAERPMRVVNDGSTY